MDYVELKTEQKIEGLRQRILDLEGQHFSNIVATEEAVATGDENAAKIFTEQNKVLQKRINANIGHLQRLQDQLSQELEKDDGSNT